MARIAGFRFTGFTAWVLWRTIYLLKLPGADRKLRVMMDWTLDLLFARDLSLLRADTTPRLGRVHLGAGDLVFSKGDPAVNFYILDAGSIAIREGGRVLKTIRPGQHFGESELRDHRTRAADAIALTASELVVMPGETFHTLARARLQAATAASAATEASAEAVSTAVATEESPRFSRALSSRDRSSSPGRPGRHGHRAALFAGAVQPLTAPTVAPAMKKR